MLEISEAELRKQADQPTIRMIHLWQYVSERTLGTPIDVIFGDRRDNPQLQLFSSAPGEMNIAHPALVNGKLVLFVWLDSYPQIRGIIVAHEIGHWVLKLQGFHSMRCLLKRNAIRGLLLNWLAHHPPLFALQKLLGQNPQEMIDSQTDRDMMVCSREPEKPTEDWTRNALFLADDMLNCSSNKRTQLESIMAEKHPNTLKLVKQIADIRPSFKLSDPKQNLEFSRQVIDRLQLGKDWIEWDDAKTLARQVKQALHSSEK